MHLVAEKSAIFWFPGTQRVEIVKNQSLTHLKNHYILSNLLMNFVILQAPAETGEVADFIWMSTSRMNGGNL